MNVKAVTLARRSQGVAVAEDFALVEHGLIDPTDGEIAVKVDLISIDPAMRGWMNDTRSYIAPVAIGEPLRAIATGKVTSSRHRDFKDGDAVAGLFGVQSHWTGPPQGVHIIDTQRAESQRYLSILGMPGQTAYFGLLEVGQLQDGETVVVSAATGGVGSLVGQIAKAKGCRVIGIAGGPDKCRRGVGTFGYDACIDYKSEDVANRLRLLTGGRIDVYFDNVGRPILEAAMGNLAKRARVVICGAIAGYNDMTQLRAPRNYINLLIQSARMEGFVVFDYFHRYGEANAAMLDWLNAGQIVAEEQIEDGLDFQRRSHLTSMQQLTFVKPNHVEWREVTRPVLQNDKDAIVRPFASTTCDLDQAIIRGGTPYRAKRVAVRALA